MALGAVFVAGIVFRVLVYGQSLVGDELSTLWIVSHNGPWGTVSFVATDAEITPPLFFVLAKLARAFGSAPELIRLPSTLAGIAMIPVIFGIGRIAIGRRAACVAAAIASLSPFLIYFSGNARAYSVMLLMVAASTLCLLLAARDGQVRAWA